MIMTTTTVPDVRKVTIQYSKDGYILTGGMYDEDDADSVLAWEGDFLAVSVSKTKRGRWIIDNSDGNILISWYAKRFSGVWDALAFLGNRWGIDFEETWDEQF